ncbi:MAG TPA: S-layer homology domain-containing protein [Anaerovoracaceae bacterium]|nr:S-layer homology domain-containing protein [Anaerovoracaceae bacterium]
MQNNFNKNIAVLLAVMITVVFIPINAYAANAADTITYTTDVDEEVDFEEEDFNEVCLDLTDDDYELDYVKFTLPSSSRGTLYYDYYDDEEEVTSSDRYYYDDDDEPSISDVTLVPDDEYSGTFTISYRGWDEDGNEFTGSVKITVDDDDSDSDGDIEYSVDADDTVTFKKADFNDYCRDENDETLDYLYFELPSSSKGILYYDYDDDKERVDEEDEYYYSKSPSISDITFVPNDDYSGDVEIDFSGYDVDADTISGTVLISVNNDDLDEADDIEYSVTVGSHITFNDDDINEVCEDLTDESLDYVRFTLPTSSKGTLYYNYNSSGSNTKVSASTKYYYKKSSYLKNVSFVPSGSTGTVTISYTGYNSEGSAFSGEISISVKAKTVSPNTTSQYFNDVTGNYSWAVQYVDSLYPSGVLTGTLNANGTRSFNPSSNITRGDFMLILSRALNLTSGSGTSGFSDVPSGSYYYEAITAAKALGIAQGTNNRFNPTATITREDAMVLTMRAMSVSGMGYVPGDTSTLSSFNDQNMISNYARDAIATLVKSGIITGSNNQINPKYNITRAEAAAVIYRVKY